MFFRRNDKSFLTSTSDLDPISPSIPFLSSLFLSLGPGQLYCSIPLLVLPTQPPNNFFLPVGTIADLILPPSNFCRKSSSLVTFFLRPPRRHPRSLTPPPQLALRHQTTCPRVLLHLLPPPPPFSCRPKFSLSPPKSSFERSPFAFSHRFSLSAIFHQITSFPSLPSLCRFQPLILD